MHEIEWCMPIIWHRLPQAGDQQKNRRQKSAPSTTYRPYETVAAMRSLPRVILSSMSGLKCLIRPCTAQHDQAKGCVG